MRKEVDKAATVVEATVALQLGTMMMEEPTDATGAGLARLTGAATLEGATGATVARAGAMDSVAVRVEREESSGAALMAGRGMEVVEVVEGVVALVIGAGAAMAVLVVVGMVGVLRMRTGLSVAPGPGAWGCPSPISETAITRDMDGLRNTR